MDESSAGPGAVRLVHDDDRERYEALEGAEVVGVLYYGDETPAAGAGVASTTVRDLRSTVVAPERSGRGVGTALVRFALEDARDRGLRVRATCWFARGILERPEHADLREDPAEDEGRATR
ncbi:GNAT family N-acetyltransferase [Brachybacterium sacelli]|uniref:GNAT family acetyltransferase n=1 Tax=Brachybacterium sacelli TaxID=173364 RepID=A0ABS4X1P5_9MICO|nr:GNAT family N-acetyltransferase [Brachybacterium sacelli]MBP2382370.1 putative GNAT family acetyltransferase [Brachybacterium sacelli]